MTDNITPAELEAWRAAREKATSGEWITEIDDPCSPWYVFADGNLTATALMYADAAFIANAANNWLRLLDEITRLQAECDRLRHNERLATELIDWERGLKIGRGYGAGWKVFVSPSGYEKFGSMNGKFFPILDDVFAKIEEIESRPDVQELEGPK